MALRDLTDPDAVVAAMAEADRLGEVPFLAKYGFDPSRRYRIAHDDRTYASKPILAAAHGVQFPDRGPLSHTDFNGGRETVNKARALGFEVVDLETTPDDLGIALARFMRLFPEARAGKFSHAHPAVEAIRRCAELVEALLPPSLTGATVRPSVGQGNWASVPWIAVLDRRETTTTQHGVYPVLLFHEDLQAVEVTLAQGVTELNAALGRREAARELRRRADLLRADLEALREQEFRLDADFELGRSALGRDYVASTVVHRRFAIDELAASTVSEDVRAALTEYGALLSSGTLSRLGSAAPPANERRALMVYVGQGADANFASGGREGWWGWKEAPSELEELRPGDLIAFGRGFDGGSPRVEASIWQSGRLREVVVGRVLAVPQRTDQLVMPDELAGEASYPWKIRFEHIGRDLDVKLAPRVRLSEQAGEALRRSALTRGIGVLVPTTGSPLLEDFLDADTRVETVTPQRARAVARAFVAAVEDSGLRLPPDDITAFLAALVTKPFAILTGQSGSGKTQLAKRLGEWFGSDTGNRPRYHVVPVRPDWTGPEYLFGYLDALRSGIDGEIWAVPDALEFILRAVGEPGAPYLLVLDEMNLAHVERYFADFLSGVESREPVLPELVRLRGQWTATGNSQRVPLPRNLFIVGTVNVDETTYLFSPKVLDRAFTFEFRTAAADLDPTLRRPTSVAAGSTAHREILVQLATDDNWQHDHPSGDVPVIAEALRTVHGVLSRSGHDFGHRVFYESLRYAAVLAAMGIGDSSAVLDRIVLTKLLPKMHGTRARIEKPMTDLRDFTQGDNPGDAPARMPLTAAKLDRMLAVLRDMQFVSFTE